jgi:hypothetical protein
MRYHVNKIRTKLQHLTALHDQEHYLNHLQPTSLPLTAPSTSHSPPLLDLTTIVPTFPTNTIEFSTCLTVEDAGTHG